MRLPPDQLRPACSQRVDVTADARFGWEAEDGRRSKGMQDRDFAVDAGYGSEGQSAQADSSIVDTRIQPLAYVG